MLNNGIDMFSQYHLVSSSSPFSRVYSEKHKLIKLEQSKQTSKWSKQSTALVFNFNGSKESKYFPLESRSHFNFLKCR
jgi:hypothetical protein